MNKVILMGRLTRDPEIRNSNGDGQTKVAQYTLAVDRRYKKEGGPEADFPRCIAFGKAADFAESYLHQGMKIAVVGRIQTGSYTNKDGQKVYTTDVIVEEHYFAESKGAEQERNNSRASARSSGSGQGRRAAQQKESSVGDGFMEVPDDVEDDGLPWN